MSADKARYRLQPSVIWMLFRRFRGHLKPFRRTLYGAAICMVGASVMEILRPWPIKVIFDGVLVPQAQPGRMIEWMNGLAGSQSVLLAAMALSILTIATIGGLFSFGQAFLTSTVGQKVVAAIRQQLYSHIQRLSQSFHDEHSSGDLLARLTGDVRMMRDLLVSAAIFVLSRLLVVIGMVTVMALMDWRLTLVALAVLPVLGLTAVKFGSKIKNAARRQRRKESKITQVMAESISAIRLVQAYARESHEDERFARQNSASAQAGLVATRLEANLDRFVQIILALGTCLVIWYGVTRVQLGVLTPGDLLVFTAYLAGLYKPVRKIASLTGRMSKAAVCGERIVAILDLGSDIADAPDAVPAPRFDGKITFKDVHFAYPSGNDVLTDANLEIAAGEHIAFVSESGSGKTTVANLILRFYDPQHGVVSIDGVDIRQFTLSSLRNQIAIVLQDSVLFNTTIYENIAYGKLGATEAEIIAAAKAANAHEFIEAFPNGYDEIVGERGAMLSGGQRQRIAIARALVRDAPMLILDEPLTGLDHGNEALVRSALERLIRGRTCIIITHDWQTAQIADRVMTIADGQLRQAQHASPQPPVHRRSAVLA